MQVNFPLKCFAYEEFKVEKTKQYLAMVFFFIVQKMQSYIIIYRILYVRDLFSRLFSESFFCVFFQRLFSASFFCVFFLRLFSAPFSVSFMPLFQAHFLGIDSTFNSSMIFTQCGFHLARLSLSVIFPQHDFHVAPISLKL